MSTVALIRRLRDEFTAMPGLRLTEAQVQRLCDVSPATGASALRALVSAGFLRPLEDGSYRRADLPPGFGASASSGAMEAPWRRILCLIEFEDDTRECLTVASHSALSYATTLGAGRVFLSKSTGVWWRRLEARFTVERTFHNEIGARRNRMDLA